MASSRKKAGNVPNLRFQGFEGEWETKKLRQMGEIITGSTPPTNDESFYNGEYLFVSPADIQENRFIFQTKTTVTEKGFKKGRKIRGGSTLFVCIGSTIGKIGQATRDCITNQQINSIVPIDNNDDFVFSMLEFHSSKIKNLSAEQAVPIVNKTTFSNFEIKTPLFSEQKKIAAFFALIDGRILTQSKIIEGVNVLKAFLVDTLFSKELSLPKSYSKEKWLSYTYTDLFEVSTRKNTDIAVTNVLSASQTKGMIDRSDIDIDIKFDKKSINSYKVVESGDYVIHLRSFQGGFAFSAKKGICSPAYIILRPKPLLEFAFLKDFFVSSKFVDSLKLVTYGIRDGRSINVDEFLKLKISIPPISQQKKILDILAAIDKKIDTNTQTYRLLLNEKKFFLQNLFI